jgi:hypothetical protein
MLDTQGALDDYLRSDQSDMAEFDSLFNSSLEANAHYATTLREYMDEKYASLKEQAESPGLSYPATG